MFWQASWSLYMQDYKKRSCTSMGPQNMRMSPQGGYSNFFRIRRLGPSIHRSPQKNIRNFKHPKKIFEILATQKIFQFLYLYLKQDPQTHRNDPQTSPICDDPQKISTKSSYPPKIFMFLKTPPKILKFRILNQKK